MKIVIITSSFERPLLLERLAKIVVPILLRFNGKVKWRIFIDGDDEGYKSLFQKLNNQINKSELVQWSAHKNVGKFKTLVKGLNEQKNNCDWMVNIDDDDLLIDYKFYSILDKIKNLDTDIKAVICPRLILNLPLYSIKRFKKKKLFRKYHNNKISYFEFKKIIGDYDTTIFIKSPSFDYHEPDELSEDTFTAESLLYLESFSNDKMFFVNENIVYSQYLHLGLTQKSRINRIKNPASSQAIYKKFIESGKDFSNSIFYFKCLINFYRFGLHNKKKIDIVKSNSFFLKDLFAKVMGYFLYLLDNLIIKMTK